MCSHVLKQVAFHVSSSAGQKQTTEHRSHCWFHHTCQPGNRAAKCALQEPQKRRCTESERVACISEAHRKFRQEICFKLYFLPARSRPVGGINGFQAHLLNMTSVRMRSHYHFAHFPCCALTAARSSCLPIAKQFLGHPHHSPLAGAWKWLRGCVYPGLQPKWSYWGKKNILKISKKSVRTVWRVMGSAKRK